MSGNNRKKAIIISSSMAILAVHAMSIVARNSHDVVNLPAVHVDDELKGRIDAAIGKPDVKDAVSQSFMLLASKFGKENVSIGEKYFPGSFDQVQLAATTDKSKDFTEGGCYRQATVTSPGVSCHSACHSACHGACHGSRSWR
jgi:hypothetical protein